MRSMRYFLSSFSQWRSSSPDCTTFIKRPAKDGENVVTHRPGTRVVLDNSVEKIPREPPGVKPSATRAKRKRAVFEQQDGVPPPPEPRRVRLRLDDTNALTRSNPPENEGICHLVPVINQPRKGSSSISPSLLPPAQPLRNIGPSTDRHNATGTEPPSQATVLARTNPERARDVTEGHIERWSVPGGTAIWPKGMNSPTHFSRTSGNTSTLK